MKAKSKQNGRKKSEQNKAKRTLSLEVLLRLDQLMTQRLTAAQRHTEQQSKDHLQRLQRLHKTPSQGSILRLKMRSKKVLNLERPRECEMF